MQIRFFSLIDFAWFDVFCRTLGRNFELVHVAVVLCSEQLITKIVIFCTESLVLFTHSVHLLQLLVLHLIELFKFGLVLLMLFCTLLVEILNNPLLFFYD